VGVYLNQGFDSIYEKSPIDQKALYALYQVFLL